MKNLISNYEKYKKSESGFRNGCVIYTDSYYFIIELLGWDNEIKDIKIKRKNGWCGITEIDLRRLTNDDIGILKDCVKYQENF